MRTNLLATLIAVTFAGTCGAKTIAQEMVDAQYSKLSPSASGHNDDITGKMAHGTVGGDSHGDFLRRRPDNDFTGEEDLEEASLDDYFTGNPAIEGTASGVEDVILITNPGDGDGQQKLQIDPEFLKKIELPDQKEELSWWDEVVEFLEELLA